MRLLFSVTLVLFGSAFSDVCRADRSSAVLMAFQWPLGYEPTVDGDLQEWEIVPEEYIVRTDSGNPMSSHFGDFYDILHEMSAPPLDTTDFHIPWGVVGWSDTQNLLYVAIRVIDDEHYADESSWQDDHVDVLIDADHSGGQFEFFSDVTPEEKRNLNNAQATRYGIAVPPSPGESPISTSNAGTWMLNPLYANVAWRITSSLGEGVAITYEFSLMPFDWLDWQGVELSQSHDLEEGEVIGFNLYLQDLDTGEVRGRGFSLKNASQGTYAQNFADFRLAPLDSDLFLPSGISLSKWGAMKLRHRRKWSTDQ